MLITYYLQVMCDASIYPLAELVPTGTSVLVEGELTRPPKGAKQKIELKVDCVLEVGSVGEKYPLPKTRLTLENLRDFMHLRARTNTVYNFYYLVVFYYVSQNVVTCKFLTTNNPQYMYLSLMMYPKDCLIKKKCKMQFAICTLFCL
jgi:aspartyl/asparaginyl-tRNA synthetase